MTHPVSSVPDDVLETLGRLLASADEPQWWFDGHALEVLVVTTDPDEPLDDDDEADAHGPEWMRQDRELAGRIREDTDGRYVRIPVGSTGSGRLRDFVGTLTDPELAAEVVRVLRGAGAYRRVKDVLARHGALDLWFRFEAERQRSDALAWLIQEGIVVDDASSS